MCTRWPCLLGLPPPPFFPLLISPCLCPLPPPPDTRAWSTPSLNTLGFMRIYSPLLFICHASLPPVRPFSLSCAFFILPVPVMGGQAASTSSVSHSFAFLYYLHRLIFFLELPRSRFVRVSFVFGFLCLFFSLSSSSFFSFCFLLHLQMHGLPLERVFMCILRPALQQTMGVYPPLPPSPVLCRLEGP